MASELYVETLKGLTSGANANKVTIPSGQTLDASAGGFTTPAGHVIQVVTATSETAGSTTSTSFVSYMSANITPSSASSKVLIVFSSPLGYQDTGGQNFYHFTTLFRDSTDLGRSNGNGISGTYQNGISYNDFPLNNVTMHLLDSPNTTSQTTYSMRHKVNTSSASVRLNLDGVAHLTLMEIAG
tara:strand:- start:39 stop:590 length:552 start_codon:yes stop_codon:yes gene_type:complete